jgi:hypothetical protein
MPMKGPGGRGTPSDAVKALAKAIPAAADTACQIWLWRDVHAEAVRILKDESHYDTGALVNSAQVTKIGDHKWQLAYTARHAAAVEFGSKSHRPPYGAIFGWVKRKGIDFGDGPRSAAWAICNSIAKKGTEPVRFLSRAHARALPKFAPTVEKEMSKAILGVTSGAGSKKPDFRVGGNAMFD